MKRWAGLVLTLVLTLSAGPVLAVQPVSATTTVSSTITPLQASDGSCSADLSGSNIEDCFSGIVQTVEDVINSIRSGIARIEGTIESIRNNPTPLKELDGIFNSIADALQGGVDIIAGVEDELRGIVDSIGEISRALQEFVDGLFDALREYFIETPIEWINGIIEWLDNLVDTVGDTVTGFIDDVILDPLAGFVDGIINFMQEAFGIQSNG
jgi:phage-related protein